MASHRSVLCCKNNIKCKRNVAGSNNSNSNIYSLNNNVFLFQKEATTLMVSRRSRPPPTKNIYKQFCLRLKRQKIS